MTLPINPNMAHAFAPPVMEARRWLDGIAFPDDRPLINVSQAAPVDLPHADLRAAMARMIEDDPGSHLYGPVLGLPDLRSALAARWSSHYGGTVAPEQVAITSGCNQAFTAIMSAIAGPGDAVLVPIPYYFNHAMWLDMAGVEMIPLPCGPGMIPDAEHAASLLTERTKAIILVTPNNPTGAEYPAETLTAFRDLARAHGLALIVDETYRDFHAAPPGEALHDLFSEDDWDDTVVGLYSFSKAYRLTGHRVGAAMASPRLLAEVEKFLDTVAICPNQLAQRATLWGMQNLDTWLAGERQEILTRRAAINAGFPALADRGWQLLGAGAYFAYVAHPYDMPSDALAPHLVRSAGVLALPGTMFMPQSHRAAGAQQMRIAFANIDSDGIAALFERLQMPL